MAKARFGSAVMTSTDKEADEAWVSARFCLSTNKGPNPEAGASAWEETVLAPHNRARGSMTQFA